MKHNKYWFNQKKYGYGVTPKTWEGWLTLVVFAFLAICLVYVIPSARIYYAALTLLVLTMIGISKEKTKDPWEWRWGKRPKKK